MKKKNIDYHHESALPTGFKRVLLIIFSALIILFLTGSYALVSVAPSPTPTVPAIIIPTTQPQTQVSAQPTATPEVTASPTATP